MNKKEFAKKVAMETGVPAVNVLKVFNCMADVLIETLASNEKVSLGRLGNFRMKELPKRTRYNPAKNEHAKVAASKRVSYKQSLYFKEKFSGESPKARL